MALPILRRRVQRVDFIKNGWQQMPVLRWTSGRRKTEQPVKDPPGNSSRVELREERNNYTRSGFGLVKAGILVESSCGHEWKAKIYDRTVRKVPCPKCEQEFVYVLPQLLVMLYTGQNHLKVEFDTDDLTGIRMEMYIPELNLAIEERSTDERNHEQKVKRYICELQDVRYILYEPFKSAEDAAAFIRTILKEHHVHIKTAAADDIALCREKYNLLKRRKLR